MKQFDGDVLRSILLLLNDRPELADTLRRITEWEREHYKDEFFRLGWEWDTFDPPIKPQTLHMMHLRGILRQVYKSRSCTGYLTRDPGAALEALRIFDAGQSSESVMAIPEKVEIPRDLFNLIIGHDDVKQMILKALDISARVHWLFVGPSASAKTLFLLCIEKLPGSGYILGSRMSKAGLSDYLIDAKPRFLLVYEIDKLPAKDLAPLLSLCETGRVVETLYGRRREVTLETIVFAAANRVSGIPRELLSRFEFLEFSEYTRDQFIEVSSRLLQRDEGAIGEVAVYIAENVWDVLGVKDVSEAVRIARLAKTKKEVDDHVSVIRKYLPKRRARAPSRA